MTTRGLILNWVKFLERRTSLTLFDRLVNYKFINLFYLLYNEVCPTI